MSWIEPIFDRNSEDLADQKNLEFIGFRNLNHEQKTQWLSGLKGYFNYIDCNRIEGNCKFISDLYGGLPEMIFKVDWCECDILTVLDVRRIVENITKLRDFCRVYEDTPTVPEPPINTYQKLNDLEKILYDIHYIYENESGAFARDDIIYGSEIYCGDKIGDI